LTIDFCAKDELVASLSPHYVRPFFSFDHPFKELRVKRAGEWIGFFLGWHAPGARLV